MHPVRLSVAVSFGLLLALGMSGCGSSAPSAASAVAPTQVSAAPPGQQPTVAPAQALTVSPDSSYSPSATASAVASASARVPSPSAPASADQSIVSAPSDTLSADLHTPGVLTACTNFPNPPMAWYDAAGKPLGVNVDIDSELARRLGLKSTIPNLPFDQLIDAVVDGRCDVSVSSQNILASRLAQIDMIPYTQGVLHLIVRARNESLVSLLDACGHAVAVQTGSTYADYVRGTVDYAGAGLDQQCAAAGRQPVDLREYADSQAAIDALAKGDVDAYIGNDLIASQRPTVFRLAAALPPVKQGIGIAKAHRALRDAINAAFQTMVGDGSYAQILHRHGADLLSIAPAP